MSKGALVKSGRGAVASGASATGAATLAAMALGAVALGAIAVGALAVGRLSVGRARLRRVEIGELAVGRLEIGPEGDSGVSTVVSHVRAAPGKGDDFERLIAEEIAASGEDAPPYRAHRSRTDPELFLFQEDPGSGAGARFDALLREAAEEGLLAASKGDRIEVYRPI